MTWELDPARVAEVTTRLRRHRDDVARIAGELAGVGRTTGLDGESGSPVTAAVQTAERVAEQLGFAATLLAERAEQVTAADRLAPDDTRSSLAGGTVVCSAIGLFSPIPARPSTSGATGVIDTTAMARDAAALVETAMSGSVTLAARTVPLVSIVAALADLALCHLGTGSGAAISTRRIVDEEGELVYEGSRSGHPFQDDTGAPLSPDLTVRDREMWNVEHRNELGYVTDPYPGYPAYEVNAP